MHKQKEHEHNYQVP